MAKDRKAGGATMAEFIAGKGDDVGAGLPRATLDGFAKKWCGGRLWEELDDEARRRLVDKIQARVPKGKEKAEMRARSRQRF